MTGLALAQSSLTGVITSATGIVTVIGLCVTIVLGYLQIRKVRSESMTTGRAVNDQLSTIHTLVNSTLTASIESDLDATRLALVTMRALVTELESAGKPVPPETVAAMTGAETKIEHLTQQMADRLVSAESVLSQGSLNPVT